MMGSSQFRWQGGCLNATVFLIITNLPKNALWYRSNPFDVGTTTFQSIGAAVRGESNSRYKSEILDKKGYAFAMNWGAISGEAKFSKANGSLMRATPLGVFAHNLEPEQIAEIARADCATTHPNPTCGDAVACYAIAIAHLLNNPGDNRGAFAVAKSWLTSDNKDSEVCAWLTDAEGSEPIECYPNAGFIKIGFTLAFRHLYKNTPYAVAIAETIAGGGDSDTNACIVGGLVGALHGAENIPQEMKIPVLTCNTQLGRPRPDFLHPRHLQKLTEEIFNSAPKPV
eukprot:Phypoly_transcript_12979.p1 GENE.Phypoly_transcript_12979~~Phypoly_transcript_12979.p1  ORF type:complete len:284 (+),score=30.80 Phypoly_transcript_12979:151-1002(+)